MSALGRPAWTDAATRYPPLVFLAAALVLALLALPSALILPQANPAQTLEYAPVPGSSNQSSGNFAGLGLGSSSTLGANGIGGTGLPNGSGTNPSSYQCVGSPPRQTEDPLAPPCVAFFNGDNGGATYQGVTRSQITVLFYLDAGWNYQDCGAAPTSAGYYDLSAGQSDGTCVSRILAGWERYFNQRFATYNRVVRFWMYYSTAMDPAGRRSDASDNFNRLHPFAVVGAPTAFVGGYADSYQQAMNQHGVLYFTAAAFEPTAYYRRYAPLLWGYSPSLEEQARNWASYVCTQIKPYQSSFAGSALNGRPRKYGAIETSDSTKPLLEQFQATALSYVQSECGIQPFDTAKYPIDGFYFYSGPESQSYSTYAQPAMAKFSSDNITTILWPGGYEVQLSMAAAQLHYYPEWVTAGDGNSDAWNTGTEQDPTAWMHDIVVTPLPRIEDPSGSSSSCVQAYHSAEPTAPSTDIRYACAYYPGIFQMFVGIQVAGPRLTPSAVDQGFHAIPPHPSHDPETPACYYDPGDYTCVKDGTAQYWDSTYPNTYDLGGRPGCYRMPLGGARYVTGGWPDRDAAAGRSSSDPCNGYEGIAFGDVAGPPGTG